MEYPGIVKNRDDAGEESAADNRTASIDHEHAADVYVFQLFGCVRFGVVAEYIFRRGAIGEIFHIG